MNDLEAIRSTVVRAAHLLDDKRFDDWGALLADDVHYVVNALDLTGRDQVVSTIAPLMSQAVTKHLLGYPLVEQHGPDEAEAWTDVVTFAGPKGAIVTATAGRYHDRLVRDDAHGWRLASRVLLQTGA